MPEHATSRPVFLFGYHRSGTTLLSLMVGAHPDIAVPFSTTDLWYRFFVTLEDYNRLASKTDVRRLIDDILQDERVKLWDVELTAEDVLRDMSGSDYPAIIRGFHMAYARKLGKARWGNISIQTMRKMNLVNDWFPNAQFIHIVRDGRDVAVSHMNYRYGVDNVFDGARKWISNVGTNLRMGEMLGPERYLSVRYEDLILKAEQTLKRICRFLELPYSPEMKDHLTAGQGKIPNSKKELWPIIDKPLDPSRVGQWRNRLSRTQRNIIEAHGGELLRELEYEDVEESGWTVRSFLADTFYYMGRDGRYRRIRQRFSRQRD